MESDGFPRSGRWFEGEVARDFGRSEPDEQELLAMLHALPRLRYGGSYWRGSAGIGKWCEKQLGAAAYLVLATSIWKPEFKPDD